MKVGDEFGLDEDLPEPVGPHEPELVNTDLLIEVPEPNGMDGEFDFGSLLEEVPEEVEPRKDWPDFLASAVYADDVVEITGLTLKGLKSISLDASGFVKYKPADQVETEVDAAAAQKALPAADELAKRLKEQVRSLATELLFEKGFAGKHTGAVYGALMDHVGEKFLADASTSEAPPLQLLYAGERLHDVRATFMSPGVVAGIITYPLATVSA